MRILLITGSFPPMRCGVGDYAQQLALALARDPGLQVAVLTSKAAAALGSPAEYAFFPIVEAWQWREIRKIVAVLRSWAPDLVHIQYPTLGYGQGRLPWLLPLYLRACGIPVVQTWHEAYSLKFLLTSRRTLRIIAKALAPGGLVVVRRDYQEGTTAALRWTFLNKTVRFIPNASVLPTVQLTPEDRDALRTKYARPNTRVIAHFGFIYPRKRVELLFQIADSDDSHLVIIGGRFSEADLRSCSPASRAALPRYYRSLEQLSETPAWKGKVTLAGFLPSNEAARVMAAADAVVLPMLGGGEGWNTSVHAAQAQGTFVLTTAKQRRGYNPEANTYFAGEHDIDEMRMALKQYAGRRAAGSDTISQKWQAIRESHVELYRTQIPARARATLQRVDT